jgi:hypothetical protein
MGKVFKNAFLTIAVSATAESSDGFLTRRPPCPSPCKLELLSTGGDSVGHVYLKLQAIPKGQIDTRAWCLQENVLSTRILTFGPEECFFECRKGYQVSETGVYDFANSRDFYFAGNLTKSLSSATNIFQISEVRNDVVTEVHRRKITGWWYYMIGGPENSLTESGYTNRNLTYRSDKLPALSGLAHEVHKVIKCNYLAGLWESHIGEGLLWRKVWTRGSRSPCFSIGQTFPLERGDPQAPSWSWAASNNPVSYLLSDFNKFPKDGIKIIVEIIGTND